MRRRVVSVDSASDGYEAGKLILEDEGEYVLVENNDTVIGIITLRHFVEEILKWKAAPSDMRVRHIMSTPVHMIDSDATVEKAAVLMSSKKIRRLPVLKEEKIIGIVLASDIDKLKLVASKNREEIAEKGGVSENLDVAITG